MSETKVRERLIKGNVDSMVELQTFRLNIQHHNFFSLSWKKQYNPVTIKCYFKNNKLLLQINWMSVSISRRRGCHASVPLLFSIAFWCQVINQLPGMIYVGQLHSVHFSYLQQKSMSSSSDTYSSIVECRNVRWAKCWSTVEKMKTKEKQELAGKMRACWINEYLSGRNYFQVAFLLSHCVIFTL